MAGYAADMGATAAGRTRELPARVERLCGQPLGAKALREQLVAQLRSAVRFDGYNFPLTDPISMVGTSPLADVPGLAWLRLPELIRSRYLTLQCRWDQLVNAGRSATSLLVETAGQPQRSLLWRTVQRDLGVIDTAIVVFTDRYGCWGLLDLWRTSHPGFDATELALLDSLAPDITLGLRRAVARTFVDPHQQLLPVGPAVVILDPELHVPAQTEAAARALLQLNPPDEPMAPIPAAAYNIAAALIASEQGVPLGPIWSRVHLGGCRWVTIKASRLGGDIAVSIEPSTAEERMDLYARACALSERESEILKLLGQGPDTRQIAERLVISEHTATDHTKAILAKTGARNRQLLLARALGATGT
jgi:DNA-binding CsgD family transcriptional regulator